MPSLAKLKQSQRSLFLDRTMGLLDKLAQLLGLKKKEANIIVVGLDNSGE